MTKYNVLIQTPNHLHGIKVTLSQEEYDLYQTYQQYGMTDYEAYIKMREIFPIKFHLPK
jgi:hypothetical protein